MQELINSGQLTPKVSKICCALFAYSPVPGAAANRISCCMVFKVLAGRRTARRVVF